MGVKMKSLKKFFLTVDRIIEEFTKISLLAMIVIVCVQVFSRKLFNFTFSWSQDVTMLLMLWFSFFGISIGFREKVHLAFLSVVEHFSPKQKKVIDIMNALLGIAFGIFLIQYGTKMAINDLMQEIPSLGVPMTIRSICIPLSGILTIIYCFLQLLGIDTRRYKKVKGGH